MVKLSRKPEDPTKAAVARTADVRVHFKNTFEVVSAIRGKDLDDAMKYLHDVLDHKRCIPFKRYNGGVGRCAQAKEFKTTQGRWPEKSVRHVLNLLENAQANAEAKSLDMDNLYIWHVAVQAAPKGRRRTYRAHGRINPYMSNPTHMEVILRERPSEVPKPVADSEHKVIRFTPRQMALKRLIAKKAH